MSKGASVQDYLHDVERHVAQLGCVGESMSDQELISIALRNLPDSWYNFVAVYGVVFSKDSPDSNFANLEEFLQVEAARRNSRSEQQSLLAAAPPERRTFPPTFPNRYQGRGRGRAFRPRQQLNDPRGANCTHCHRRGHREVECYIKNVDTGIQNLNAAQLRELSHPTYS